MKHPLPDQCLFQRYLRAMAIAVLMLMSGGTFAAPGAHGPNGEHLDGPAPTAASGSNAPRLEAKSEIFELVATLRTDELSMLINRFETNEPVLDAKVEVESGDMKVIAKFHADLGDYAVDDATFLAAMQAPGDHALVITVLAGEDNDLLDGTFSVAHPSADAHGHAHDDARPYGLPIAAWIAIVLAVLSGLGWAVFRNQRRPTAVIHGNAR